MDILVVCNTIAQAKRLYWKFYACDTRHCHISHNPDKLRIGFTNADITFVTKNDLDICLLGRHDAKIWRAADVEAVLDRRRRMKGES